MDTIKEVLEILSDKKAENIKIYFPGKNSSISDYVLITTVGSTSHMKTILNTLLKNLKKKGIKPFHPFEMDLESGWNILDYGYFIIHVFLNEKRNYYPVDDIWKDFDITDNFT